MPELPKPTEPSNMPRELNTVAFGLMYDFINTCEAVSSAPSVGEADQQDKHTLYGNLYPQLGDIASSVLEADPSFYEYSQYIVREMRGENAPEDTVSVDPAREAFKEDFQQFILEVEEDLEMAIDSDDEDSEGLNEVLDNIRAAQKGDTYDIDYPLVALEGILDAIFFGRDLPSIIRMDFYE